MDGSRIGYVRILTQWAVYSHFLPKKDFFCSDFNFMLSDSPENVAFSKNLVLGHFVTFPVVNWTQK